MYFLKRGFTQSFPLPLGQLLNLKDFLLVLTLFSLNFIFLWPFFGQSYPLTSFSSPILPFLAWTLTVLSPLSFAQGVGVLVLISFPLSSLTWYTFFKKLSSSSFLGFLSGLIFLLPWFYLPRFTLFWFKGDALHALGFALLPLAGLIFGQFLKAGSFKLFLTSVLGVSFISLVSPFALLNLYLFFLVLTFSEMLLGEARMKALKFLLVCLFAQGLSSFWYHPQFLLSLLGSSHGQAILSSFGKLFPISLFTVPILGAFSFLLFDRKPHLQPLFFGLTLTTLYLALVAAENFGQYLPFPVPDRFLPEFYIGSSFLAAMVIVFLVNLPRKGLTLGKIHPRLAFLHHASKLSLTAIVTALLFWPVFSLLSKTPIISPHLSPQVLGLQSPWWEISLGGGSRLIGYGISLLTAVSGFFLHRQIKR